MAKSEDEKIEHEGGEDKTETPVNESGKEQVEAAAGKEAISSASALSAEDEERLNQMRQDLHWLITEGYVAEFGNGALFAHPARALPSRSVNKHRRSQVKKVEDKAPPSVETPEEEKEV